MIADDSNFKQEVTNTTKTEDSRLRAIFAINVQALCVAGSSIFFKFGYEQGVPVIDYGLVRAVLMFIFIQPFRICAGERPCNQEFKHKFWLVVLRTIVGTSNFLLSIIVLTMVPLYLAVILNRLAPFWTSLLANWIRNEPIFLIEYFAMAFCFICVIGIALTKDQGDEEN
jgi:drug/metabolite transporter (DMT)-like permease